MASRCDSCGFPFCTGGGINNQPCSFPSEALQSMAEAAYFHAHAEKAARVKEIEARQLAQAQANFAAGQLEKANALAARSMIQMSGVNAAPCNICTRRYNGLSGLKNHMRSHYTPFICACGSSIANTSVSTIHSRTCGFNTQLAEDHFRREDVRLMGNHKTAHPDIWSKFPHHSF